MMLAVDPASLENWKELHGGGSGPRRTYSEGVTERSAVPVPVPASLNRWTFGMYMDVYD
jgi:hypothetical protein